MKKLLTILSVTALISTASFAEDSKNPTVATTGSDVIGIATPIAVGGAIGGPVGAVIGAIVGGGYFAYTLVTDTHPVLAIVGEDIK